MRFSLRPSVVAGTICRMTDTPDKHDDATSPSTKKRKRYRRALRTTQPDILLGMFTDLAEESGLELGVTLTVGGSVVTGLLVGRREWLRRLVAYHDELLPVVGSIQETWDREAAEETPRDERGPDYLPPYESKIHLVDARYVTSGQNLPTGEQSLFWRGQLSEVDGWSFGTLS